MLSRFDDYPLHQTPESLTRPASSDRNVYDRYWFNGYDRDAAFYFGIGLGVYPNRGVMDCALSVVADGEQHSFHASRRAPSDPSETQVGPFRIEILRPMHSLRVVLEPNSTGLEADLVFVPRTACFEEGRQTLRGARHIVMDATRFAQLGRWQGRLAWNGREQRIDPARVFATKDRSWGIRPVGEPESGGAPSLELPQIWFLWSPLHWADRVTHVGLFEDASGKAWHRDALWLPAYEDPEAIPGLVDPRAEHFEVCEREIQFRPGTRRVERASFRLAARSGLEMQIELEPRLCFQMKGIGYQHPRFGHGRWRGELDIAGESWKSVDLDPTQIENIHVQQVVRARCGAQEGVGVLEHMSIGPHAPSGFRSLIDGAS